jgi:hypothetical protein
MSRPSDSLRVGAAVAALAILAGVAVGMLQPSHPTGNRHARVRRDGGRGAAQCYRVDVRADPAAQALLGVESSTGYATVRVCAEASDGGMPALPSGIVVVEGSERETEAATEDDPDLEAWTDEVGACACGPGCVLLEDGGAVSWEQTGRNVLPRGRWAAPDAGACARTPCVVLLGSEHIPEACR